MKTRLFSCLLLPALLLSFACRALNVTNYSFSALAGTYTQIKGNPGVTSPGLTWGSLDDGYINAIPIGFSFIYEGITYTTVAASTNGFCRLGSLSLNSWNTNNLATGTPRPMLAPLWDDNMMAASNDISYITTGTAPNRVFTLEWLDVYYSYLSGSASISFQVKLYEANRRIEFIYRQEAGTSSSPSASIGLGGLVSGNFISLNGTSVSPAISSATETTNIFTRPNTGQIYRFDHYGVVPVITSVSPLSGQYGNVVTITGSGFDAAPSSNVVYFGATKATVLSASYTMLTVAVPEGLTHDALTVTTMNSHLTATASGIFDLTFPCGGTISSSSYAAAVNTSIGAWSFDMKLADIDLDGKADLAISAGSGVYVMRNTSVAGTINASSFAAPVFFQSSGNSSSVDLADLDGDGKLDMLIGDVSLGPDDSVCVYRNTSTPGVINASSFAPRVMFSAGDYDHVTTGDIDGDGRPEILTANPGNDNISIYRNTCTPGSITTASFQARVNYTAGNSPWECKTADIDGDGKMDVICTNSFDNTMYVFRNTASSGVINAASLAAPVSFATGSGPIPIQVADMDGDGTSDVVVGNSSSPNNFSVFRNTSTVGSVSFAAKVDVATGARNYCIDVGDIDGDGKPDVASGSTGTSNYATIVKNTSTPGALSFTSVSNCTMTASPSKVLLGDIDGDGKPEITTCNGNSNNVSCLQNVISNFAGIAPLTVINSTVYCDDGTWKTFADPANPTRVLFAVKDNGNDLGNMTVSEYEDGAPGSYNGIRFLARHFKVTPSNQPATAVQVRLFYTAAELAALMAVAPSVTGAASLSVTKYDGPTEDNIYFPGDATSLVAIPQASITTGTMYGGNYLQFSISSFSEFWIHGWGGVLPIELLDFTAVPDGDHVSLNWATATETNNHFFTIERTRDGQHFETVTTVEGAGNSTTELHYAATDLHPLSGTSYYRLKQTDFNGQFSYSDLKPVTFSDDNSSFTVFPNPSPGTFAISCPGNPDAAAVLEIYDATGRLVLHSEGTVSSLTTGKTDLPQGIYLLNFIVGERKFSRQIVVI